MTIAATRISVLMPAQAFGPRPPRTVAEAAALVCELNAGARRERERAAAKHREQKAALALRARQAAAAPSASRRCATRGETVFALFERRERERLQLLAARGDR